jgi:nitroreductase
LEAGVNTDLFEIIRTTRSMRRLKPDPVPPTLIRQVLEAGTAAASGGNIQNWRFLVVRDPAVKADVAQFYRRAWYEVVAPMYGSAPPPSHTSPDRHSRTLAAAQHLADHLQEAPVWIIACLTGCLHPKSDAASIYPSVQNMLLAARALGLGATLTTLHLVFEKEVATVLGLPEGAESFALLPIGYPLGKFGPVARAPLEDVVFADRWGRAWSEA